MSPNGEVALRVVLGYSMLLLARQLLKWALSSLLEGLGFEPRPKRVRRSDMGASPGQGLKADGGSWGKRTKSAAWETLALKGRILDMEFW